MSNKNWTHLVEIAEYLDAVEELTAQVETHANAPVERIRLSPAEAVEARIANENALRAATGQQPLDAGAEAWIRVELDPEGYTAALNKTKEANNRLSLTASERFEASGDVQWLISDLIETRGIGQIWAPSYTGKTLLALDLALSVACGLSQWLGSQIVSDGPQHVVYVAAEGGASFWQHVNSWRTAHRIEWAVLDEFFHVIDSANGESVVFGEDGFSDEFESSFERLVAEWTALDSKPALIIFDTQVDVIDVDENDNKRMSGVLRYIRDYGSRQGFMSVLVHHTGHDGSRARGASSMRSKVDFMVGLRKVKDADGAQAVEVMWAEEGAKIKAGPLPQSSSVFYITTEPGTNGAYAKGLQGLAAARFTASKEIKRQNKEQEQTDAILQAIAQGKSSASQIAEETGLNRTTAVNSTLKRLEETGHIKNTGKDSKPHWQIT